MLYLQAQRERAVGAAAADGGAAAAGRRDQQLPAPAGAGRRAADQAQDHEGQQGDYEEEAGAGHLHREYSTVQYSTVQYTLMLLWNNVLFSQFKCLFSPF